MTRESLSTEMKHLLFTAENNDAKVNHREASCSQERVHKVPASSNHQHFS